MSAFEYKNSDFQNGFSSDIAGFIEKPTYFDSFNIGSILYSKALMVSIFYIQ